MTRICWLLIVVCLLLYGSVFAQEIPVKIRADKLKFIEGTGLVEASGSVEVDFEGVKIYADRMLMDSDTNVVTAEGEVRLVADEYTAASSSLVYDSSREVSDFSNFSSQISPEKVKGKLYLTAERLNDLKEKMQGEAGTLTTCSQASPHYLLRAKKIEYYPDDRIEGRNVTLYVGETAVLWMPYLRYDLKRRWRKNWVFGHNEVEGNYLKTAWDYPGGLLLLDNMEKKGWGYGTEVDYGWAALGLGTLYLYHQPEKDTGINNWVTRIDHQKQLSPTTTLKLNHRYTSTYLIPAGRMDQTAFGWQLSHAEQARWNLKFDTLDDRIAQSEKYSLQFDHALGGTLTNYSFNYDFAKNDPRWFRNSQRFFYRQPLWSDRLSFSTTTNYYHAQAREGDPGEERAEPQIEFSGSEPNFSWRYTENWFLDLRQDLYPGETRYEFLEKQPELEIYPRTLDLNLFQLQSTLGYGYYREVKKVPTWTYNRDFGAQRYRATLNASRSILLGLGTVMNLGAGIDQFAYGPGDQLYAFRENASLQTSLFSFFRNNIDFRQAYAEGNTPFFFDRLGTNYHDIREKMNFYYLDKFDWSIEGGHNWQTKKWFDAMTHLLLSPDPRVRLTLHTGWDIENRLYKDLVAGLRLAPAGFYSLDLSFTQNMNLGELRSGSALHSLYFLQGEPNQMHLSVGQVYDPSTKEFKVRDIMVVKDLHCWEMKCAYSDYRKEISVSITLKALPDEPVGFAPGRGFYYEGFERGLKEFKSEGEVRRY